MTSFPRDPAGEPGRGLVYRGLCELDEMGVSLRNVPLGGPWGGDPSSGNFEISLKQSSGCSVFLSIGVLLGKPGGGFPLLGSLKVM